MRIHPRIGIILAAVSAGAVTGLFGAGGGMVLVPLLSSLTDLEEPEIFPASISIILPICLAALAGSFVSPYPWSMALPYLLGSGLGGLIAGKWCRNLPVSWLHRLLGILILWGGIRYLC